MTHSIYITLEDKDFEKLRNIKDRLNITWEALIKRNIIEKTIIEEHDTLRHQHDHRIKR